jgi:class 3 adenylate cyclase
MDTVTVLFTDWVDSTATRMRLGEDAADDLRRMHDRLLADQVAAHDGTVVKGLGDGVMATFGSAAHGVAAAVAIQHAVALHDARDPDRPLAVRIGVSAGDVVVEAGDCFGQPVIEAARLCDLADGGQILVADVVRLLARRQGHEFRSVGERELRGLPDAVHVSEVLWEPPAPEVGMDQLPVPALLDSGARLDFSGRKSELESAVSAWKEALTGERQALLLAGEPGIGKTRLARELALVAHEQGGTVLYGRCEEDLGAPYQPFVEALDYFVQQSSPDTLPDRLGRYPGELTRLCPSVSGAVAGLPAPISSDPETERYRLFEAVASWLATAAEPAGLVLVLDDLHWATRPTLVLLQHLLHATAGARVLVTGTYRDTDLDRAHPLAGLLADLRRSPGVQRLALTGLDRDEVIRLVSHAAGHDLDDNGVELATMIHAETEGNPFFVGEILRHLRESGAVYVEDGRWVSQRAPAEMGIPEGVRDVVGRRLDRLSADANAALSAASVVGRDFELADVRAVTGLTEDAVLAGLEEAVEARLIDETRAAKYRFAHALVRSTLYEELSATRRSRMHRRVGEYLEDARPGDVSTLAFHFSQAVAGDVTKALHYMTLAGDEAMEQVAHDRAVDHYRQALELVDELPGDSRRQRCELLIALGEAQRRGGDPGYRRTLLDSAALARGLGATELLTRSAMLNSRGFWSMAGEIDEERIAVLDEALAAVGESDSADRARLLGRLAVELMFSSRDEERHALADEAVAVARRTGDTLALADTLAASIPACYVPWRAEVARDYADELIEVTARLDDPQRRALGNLWNFVAHLALGEMEIGDERLRVAQQLDAELKQPTLHWLTTAWTAFRALMRGDVDEAERLAAEAYEVGERTGQPDAFTWYAGQLWVLMRERGRVLELRDTVEQEVQRNPGLPAWQIVRGEICCSVGDLDGARSVLEQLAPGGRLSVPRDVMWLYAGKALLEMAAWVGDVSKVQPLYEELLPLRHLPAHGGVTYQGSVERYLACGARALGQPGLAVEHAEAAIAFEQHVGARTWQGIAYSELARSLRDRGTPDDLARADECDRLALDIAAQTGSVYVRRQVAGEYC